jgi:hypothetical protein
MKDHLSQVTDVVSTFVIKYTSYTLQESICVAYYFSEAQKTPNLQSFIRIRKNDGIYYENSLY